MGTKLVNSNIQLPHLMKSFLLIVKNYLYSNEISGVVTVEMSALVKVSTICAKNIKITMIPILNSSLDFLWRDLLLLSIILLSTPV
jgi:hypothetical protein